jgi:uncharacterized membrane protein YkoI
MNLRHATASRPPRRQRWVLALLALSALAGGARASDDDHDRARQAVQAGEVLKLADVLERVAPSNPGQVLEVELEREDSQWVYEIKLLQPGGRLVKLQVDARTGVVIGRREKARER